MFTLLNPIALYLFTVPCLLGFVFLLKKRRPLPTRQLLLSTPAHWLANAARRMRWIYRTIFLSLVISMGCLIYAIAQPAFVFNEQKKWAQGIDIVIVQDVSESMEATDYEPNRMVVAQKVIKDFISYRPHDRIGLVVFGGEAVTKSPLTSDADFLSSQVDELRLRELKQGTAIGMGLTTGIARLRKSESKNRVLILLTDGDSNVGAINPITAAHLARQEKIRIYCIGIGKSNRVLVPIYNYDIYGNRSQLIAQVPSYLNPALLEDISKITGGKAYMARSGNALAQVLKEIDRLETSKVRVQNFSRKDETFFIAGVIGTLLWFLGLLLKEMRYSREHRTIHGTSI